MNFMPGRPGFYEEVIASRSSTSSSSSSLHHRTVLPPYSCGVVGEGETPDDFSDDQNIFFRRGAVGREGSSTPEEAIQWEHMFDKVVTPSDVGKLNRLVIPKQHAEKHFPLDSSTNEKGLLLNFEDRNGKPWRFRYSYWNSSQSYVMTKGWSRFVKEKKLDAGDIVSFQRGVGELRKDRLFIDWRRRPDAPLPDLSNTLPIPGHRFSFHRPPPSQSVVNPWGGPALFIQQPPSSDQLYSNFLQPAITTPRHHLHHPYPTAYGNIVNGNPCPRGSIMYLRSTVGGVGRGGFLSPLGPQIQNRGAGGGDEVIEHGQPIVFQSVPVVQGKSAAKRLRLFGVNMDCPISYSDDNNTNNNINECDILLSSSAMMLPLIHPTMQLLPSPVPFDSSSLARLRSNDDDDKGKSSMSLDLDI